MKIVEDPIAGEPAYGLSKKDLWILWPLIPQEWTDSIQIVRLCNQMNTSATAEYSSVSKRLNIFGRGKTRTVLIHDILTELSSRLSRDRPTPHKKLSNIQKKNISDAISPLATQIIEAIHQAEQDADGNPH
jgi:hypothetical protein